MIPKGSERCIFLNNHMGLLEQQISDAASFFNNLDLVDDEDWSFSQSVDLVLSGIDTPIKTEISDFRASDVSKYDQELDKLYGSNVGYFSEKLKRIKSNNSIFVSYILKELGLSQTNEDLFHSPGAMMLIPVDAPSVQSFSDFGNSYIDASQDLSNVAKEYMGTDGKFSQLRRMAYEKVYFDILSRVALKNPTAKTEDVHEFLTVLTGKQYYPGGYSTLNGSVGVSACEIAPNIAEQIASKYKFQNDSELHEFDKYAPLGDYGRPDLLAGIFDELEARLLIHPESEREDQIKIICAKIDAFAEKGEMWKIC